MRVGVGTMVALVSGLVASVALSGPWARQAETGLTRLFAGALRVDLPTGPLHDTLTAGWHGPKGGPTEPAIAMSESDWLSLADDMAPVSYLPGPVVPQAPAQNEQQPL